MALGAAAAAGLAWGHWEAGWLRRRTLTVSLPRLPAALSGLRVVHLSDFHLGFPSRGERAVEQAVDWAASLSPELVGISGDLLSHPRGEPRLRRLVERLPHCFAVLGNHDFAAGRDPFARPAAVDDLGPATLLSDTSDTIDVRGRRVQVVGVDPRSYRAGTAQPHRLVDPEAELRILLCHFPGVLRRLPPGAFDLVLAGHMHSGQIVIPYPGGRLRLSQLKWTFVDGLYARDGTVMHVSPGLGTTFIPFRFFARPEATQLVVERAR